MLKSGLLNENSSNNAKVHNDSIENDECNMKNVSPYMSKDMIAAAGFNVETPIVNAIIGNLAGTLPTKKNETEIIKCEICDCELSSNIVLSFHINGSRHQKRLKALEIMEQLKEIKDKGVHLWNSDNPNAFTCEICSLTVNSAQQLEIHLSGAKHKKKFAKINISESENSSASKSSESNENTVLNKFDNYGSSREKGADNSEISSDDIKEILHYWEKFQSLVEKWHPNKDEVNKLCILVEEQCLDHFKKILEKRKFQTSTDELFTDPPTKRKKQATGEETAAE